MLLPGPKCLECPFFTTDKKNFRPTPPALSTEAKPLAILVGESPGYEEKWKGVPFIGRTGREMWARLREANVRRESLHILNRIACCPPQNKKTPKNMAKAVACCLPVFQRALASCTGTLPILYMGKYATTDSLTKEEVKLSKNVITYDSTGRGRMVVDHPTFALLRAPALRDVWIPAASDFMRAARTGVTPYLPWAPRLIGDSGASLEASPGALKRLGKTIAWDVETYGIDFQDPDFRVTCVGFSDGLQTVTIPWDSYETSTQGFVPGLSELGDTGRAIREAVLDLFADPSKMFVTHNGSYDVPAMAARGIGSTRNDFDTFLAHSIIFPSLLHNLEDSSIQLASVPERWKTIFGIDGDAREGEKYTEISPEKLRTYNAKDAEATYRLWSVLYPRVMGDVRVRGLYENSVRNAAVVVEMRRHGFCVDQKRQAQIDRDLREGIKKAERNIKKMLYGEIENKRLKKLNLASPEQMGRILYKILGEPVRVFTDLGSPSTGKAALQNIRDTGGPLARQIAAELLRHRQKKKLKEAYVDNITTAEVHPSINIARQIAGRWSVTKPALQTTPTSMKPMFVAHPGNWLVLADYSQLELRINAQCSGDADLLRVYAEGRDAHRENAGALFGLPVEVVTGELRKAAKIFVYRLSYCTMDEEAATAGIFGSLGGQFPKLTYKLVRAAVRRWWELHPTLYEDKKRVWAGVLRTDYAEEPYGGRRRYFHGKPEDTEAFNFRMQAGGAWIVDSAIQDVHSRLDHEREWLLLQRHDELIAEGPDPVRLAQILRDGMVKTYVIGGIPMQFPVEWKIGQRWGCEATIEPLGSELIVKYEQTKEKHSTIEESVEHCMRLVDREEPR